MRKHFLILMLMALLPLAGWADDDPIPGSNDPGDAPAAAAAPTEKTNLVYTSVAQDLVTAGVAEQGKNYYYAVVDKGATAPAYTAYAAIAPQKTNAGSYDVYYVEAEQAPTSEADVEGIDPLTVTIAQRQIVYFITGSTYNVGDVVDVTNHYSIATGTFADGEKLSDYAQFKFQTTGTSALPLDEYGHLTTKGTFPVSALRVVWNGENTPHNYDFRFTSTGNIVVAAKSIAGFYVAPIEEEFTFDGSAKTLTTVPALFRTEEDAATPAKALVYGEDYTTSYRKNTNAGDAELVYEGLNNYGEELIATFKIKKANIKPEDFTAPTAVAKLSYTAAEKDLINLGEFKALDAVGLAKGTFEYQAPGSTEWIATSPKAINAGTYPVKWRIKGGTNYNNYSVPDATDPVNNPAVSEWTINASIAKAKLVIQPKEALKVLYTGQAIDQAVLEAIELNYQKFYGEDDLEDVFGENNVPTVAVAGYIADAHYAKGDYKDGLVVNCPAVIENSNYDVYPVDGELDITPANVKVLLKGGEGRWNKHVAFGSGAATEATSWDLLVSEQSVLKVVRQTAWDGATPVYTKMENDVLVENVVNANTVLKTTGTDANEKFDGLKISRADDANKTKVGKYVVTLSGCTPKDANFVVFEQTVATEEEEDPATDADFAPYFYIDAQNVTVKAANKAKVYGEDDPALTLTVTAGTLEKAQKELLEKTLERVAGENVDVYDITFTKVVEEEGLSYKDGKPQIEGLNINFQDGAFAITPKTLTITAKPQTLYSGNAVSKLNGEDYKVEGLVKKTVNGVEINDQATVSLELDKTVVYSFTSFEPGHPNNVYANGTVEIVSIDKTNHKTTVKVLTNVAANTNVTNAGDFINQQYIVDADLSTAPAAEYSLHPVGDPTTAVPGVAVGMISQVSGVYVDATTTPNTLNVPGEFNNAIKPVLATASVTALAANYDINYVYGKLTVIDSNALLVLDATANNGEAIEAAATKTVNVTFKNRILKANTWYTMVLPFNVQTTELVKELKALDAPTTAVPEPDTYHSVYAIVNRMRSATDGKINFTIEMLNIPANEPFLIKTAETVDMKDVTFNSKEIVNADAIIEFGGEQFIGTYAPMPLANTDTEWYGFLGNKDMKGSKGQALDNTWYNARLDGLVINSTEAYLQYAEAHAPMVTIEDFDFETGTTAIKTLNAETMEAYSVDGWYTLNGIKLQSMPTEKGVYINNGKKVVIK